MAKLHVNHESMPEDIEIDVPPYGVFLNGHVYEVEALEDDVVVGSLNELDGDAEEDPNPEARANPGPNVIEAPVVDMGGTIPSDDLHEPVDPDAQMAEEAAEEGDK